MIFNDIFYAELKMLKRLLLSLSLIPKLAMAGFTPPATILLDYRDIELKENAGFTKTTEWMTSIDTPQGVEQNGQARLYFDSKRAKQTIVAAHTEKPDGTIIPVSADRIKVLSVDTEELSPYFSDLMMTVIIYPQVEVGSKLYYKAITEQSEPVIQNKYSSHIYFTPHRKYIDTRIRFTHPQNINLLAYSHGMEGTRNILPDGRVEYSYTFKQEKAYPPEPGRVQLSDFAPGLQFSNYASYQDLGSTFQKLIQPKTEVTAGIQDLADKLTASTTDKRAKAKILYEWVSANIRYVGVDVGSSGFEPHYAEQILANRYGDCKDHVTLLESLLLAVGITSTPALINLSDAYKLPQLAGTQFDHVITYIPDWELYLDSTAQFAEFGTLPESAQGKPTILTRTGSIHSTPVSNANADYTMTVTQLKLQKNGGFIGNTRYQPHGAFSSSSRSAQFSNEDQDDQTVTDTLLSRFGETGTGELRHGNPVDLANEWQVESSFMLDPIINLPGPSAFVIPTGVSPGYIRSKMKYRPYENRRFPYVCGSVQHTERTEIVIPKGVKVRSFPTGTNIKIGPRSYKSTYKFSGNRLITERRLRVELDKDYCDPSAGSYSDEAKYFDLIKADLRNQIFVQ